MVCIEPVELGRGAQPPLGVRQGAVAERVDRAALADAGQDIGQLPPLGRVHHGRRDSDRGQAELPAKSGKDFKALRVTPIPDGGQRQVHPG